MKKKNIIIAFFILLVLIIIALFMIHSISYKNSIENVENNIRDKYNLIVDKYINRRSYKNDGIINVTAKFKGAHGENYPSNYVYSFNEDRGVVSIYDDTNLNYISLINEDRFLNTLKFLARADISKIKVDGVKDNKIIIDTESFNEVFNTEVKDAYIIINTKGFISKVESYDIVIDEVKINIKDNNYTVTFKDNNIEFELNNSGYNLDVNDSLKMNVFFYDEKDVYSVVINDYVFAIELGDEYINIKASTSAAIYNGLDISISFNDSVDKSNYVEDLTDYNPIKRYLNGCNLVYWR